MAVDVSNFIIKPQEFEGIYKATDTLERNKLKKEQMRQAAESKKTATANFLKNYLDPKDMLSGTAYDPIGVQALNDLLFQGAQMASQGVDAPSLIMALNPGVSKVASYFQKAKTINASIDDQIKKLKDNGEEGFDFAKLKDQALKKAFYKEDPKAGSVFDITVADPSKNYVDQTITDNPELVTTSGGIEEFVKKSEKKTRDEDYKTYDRKGTLNSEKFRLIGGSYMQPEFDAKGKPTGMVPKYEIAHDEGGKVLTAPFKDENGFESEHPIRMLEEKEFDRFVGSSRSIAAKIQADTKQYLALHNKEKGTKLTMDDPKAKDYAKIIAYDELNSRSGTTIQSAGVENKQSGAQINLNVNNTPEGLQYAQNRAAAVKRGQNSEPTLGQIAKASKTNPFQVVADAFTGKIQNVDTAKYDGKDVLDITPKFPGGGLKKGKGENESFKSIYFDPASKQLIATTEEKDQYQQVHKDKQVIPEKDAGKFLYRIAEANGINTADVKGLLDKLGYSNGRFAASAAQDEEVKKEVGGAVKGVIDKVKGLFKGGKPAKDEGYFNKLPK